MQQLATAHTLLAKAGAADDAVWTCGNDACSLNQLARAHGTSMIDW